MRYLALALAFLCFSSCAHAQALPASADVPHAEGAQEVLRVRGTVISFTGTVLTIKDRDGKVVQLITGPSVGVQDVYPIPFEFIGAGSIVGTTGILQPNGHLRAIEVRLFPQGKGGPPQGHRPSNLSDGAELYNGTALSVDSTPQNRRVRLQVKEAQIEVDVPRFAPVTTYEPAVLSDLKPGVKVYLHAVETPEGLKTISATLGKDGLTPPM